MADEITISASLEAKRADWARGMAKSGLQFDMTGTRYVEHEQTIGTAEEAIQKAELSSLGYCIAINLDTTNFVSLRAGTGSGNMIRLDPNYGLAIFKFGSGATAPFAIADTAACRVLFLILEA